MPTKIDVEYCGSCGHRKQFEELANRLKDELPDSEVQGREGRRGSFEVSLDGALIHSKLQTLAFPDYGDVVQLARESTEQGKPPSRQAKQQPITCTVS